MNLTRRVLTPQAVSKNCSVRRQISAQWLRRCFWLRLTQTAFLRGKLGTTRGNLCSSIYNGCATIGAAKTAVACQILNPYGTLEEKVALERKVTKVLQCGATFAYRVLDECANGATFAALSDIETLVAAGVIACDANQIGWVLDLGAEK